MPDVKELGRKVKAKYPGVYDDLADDDVGRRVKAKYPGAYDDFTDTPAAAPAEQPPGFFENLAIGAKRGATNYILEPALAVSETLSGMKRGDVAPLQENLELLGRGALKYAAGFSPLGGMAALEQDKAIQAVRQRQAARRRKEDTTGGGFETVADIRRTADARAALDPSITGKITRGAAEVATSAAPAIATAYATGGSIPALATLGALQSAGQPENLPLNVALEAAPLPIGEAFSAGVSAIRRRFGKGAAQIIEAEATPAAVAQVRQAIGEAPPLVGEAIPSPVPTADLLPSVFNKLGTDNVEQIGAMIANANRRFGKKRTPEQIQSSMEDYRALNQLTPDENRALSQALPMRDVSPVRPDYAGKGPYSRDIQNIPMSEFQNDPQLAANLRHAMDFFDEQGRLLREGDEFIIRDEDIFDIGPGAYGQAGMHAPRISAADAITTPPPSTGGRISPETGPPALSEAPSISAVAPSVRAASAGVTGPRAGANFDALNVAVSQASQSVPKPLGRRILDELAALYHLPKSLLSSLDISAPFRQGSLLTVPPSQWGRAGRAAVRMFQAFSTKQYDRITQAIANHIDAPIADEAGLYLASKAGQGLGRAEEAFLSKYAGRIPLVKQSQQAYTTYLDSLRMDTFAKYKRVIDGQGLSPEQTQRAYKAAATWVNYATGRGSAGQRFDRIMDAANFFIFSPRYTASRFNVLNPVYYAKNAATPGGRAVLKQQMGELVQYAGMVAGTMKLAQAAGADVETNPNSPDFLKIRFGNYRYDTLAGLQQVMRLVYRAGGDITNKLRGKETEGDDALDIGGRFLRNKLAPPPAVFTDFIKGRTATGKQFSGGDAVVNLVAPIQWADFVEAYQKEGWGGAGKVSPGLTGIGVQRHDPDPVNDAIERSRPLFSELQRLNMRVADLKKTEGEADEAFNARVQQFGQNYTQFGQRLLESPRFQQAPDDIKKLALNNLNERAKGITRRPFAFPELELDADMLIDSAEAQAERKKPGQ
jgi:hypothetical protein